MIKPVFKYLFITLYFLFFQSTVFSEEEEPVLNQESENLEIIDLNEKKVEEQKIKEINIIFDGICTYTKVDEIKKKMITSVGSLISNINLDKDIRSIASICESVKPSIKREEDGIILNIFIKPSPILTEFKIIGNTAIKEKNINKLFKIKIGAPLHRKDLIQGIQAIQSEYKDKGYPEAIIKYSIINKTNSNAILQLDIDEGFYGVVNKIIFSNFSKNEEAEIRGNLRSTEYWPILSTFTGTGIYSEDYVRMDELTVLQSIKDLGYADAEITKTIEPYKTKGIGIKFTLHRGPKYHFGNVSFEGNVAMNDATIKKNININTGDAFSPKILKKAIEKISEEYSKNGYEKIDIDYGLAVKSDKTIDVIIKIAEGNQYKFGNLRVLGNKYTEDSIILNKLNLAPGEKFNNEAIAKSEATLMQTGIFDSVSITKDQNQQFSDPEYIGMKVEVKEARSLKVGIKSKDLQNRIVTLSLEERNFHLLGLTNIYSNGISSLRGMGESISLEIDTPLHGGFWSFNAGWSKPNILYTPCIIGIIHGQSKSYSGEYLKKNMHIQAYFSYKIKEIAALTFKYSFRDEYNTNPMSGLNKKGFSNITSDEAFYNIIDQKVNELYQAQANELISENSDLSSLAPKPDKDLIMDIYGRHLNAEEAKMIGRHSGPTIELSVHDKMFKSDKAFYIFATSISYPDSFSHFKNITSGVKFISIFDLSSILMNGSKLRAFISFDNVLPICGRTYLDVPLSDRLSISTQHNNMVRGYEGVLLNETYPCSKNEADVNIRGGLSSQFYRVELGQPLFGGKIEMVAFFDAGFVSKKEYKIGKPYASLGIGINFSVMGNTFNFGIALPINAKDPKQATYTYFYMG